MGSLCSSGYETIGDEQEPINIREDASRIDALKNIADKWREDTITTWQRSPSNLPINIDIPRLYKKISIIDSNTNQRLNPEFSRDNEDFSVENEEQQILKFLESIAYALDDNNTIKFLKEKSFLYFKQQDMAKQLHALILDLEHYDNNSHTLKVLKVVNQKIVFPAFYRTKSRLQLLHMKDKRGSWYIDILISGDKVKVVHKKDQLIESSLDFNKIDVEFTFSLVLEIDLIENRLTDIHIEIPHVLISQDLSREEKEHYEELFAKSIIIH